MRETLLVLGCALAACSPFRDIAPDGRCGNRVLEPLDGEDCDTGTEVTGTVCGAPGTPQACRFVCGQSAAGAVCPPGFHCGLDDTCRASGGLFAQARSLPFRGDAFRVADVNGDGRADFVVAEQGAVGLYLGDPTNGFLRSAELGAAVGSDGLSVGHLDGDRAADVAVLSGEGLVLARGDATGELLPVAFPVAEVVPGAGAYRLEPMRGEPPFETQLSVALSLGAGGTLTASVLEAADTDASALAELGPVTGLASELAVGELDRAPMGGGRTGDEIVVLASGAPAAHVLSLECSRDPAGLHCRLSPRARVDLGGATVDAVTMADLDGDGTADLLFHLFQHGGGMGGMGGMGPPPGGPPVAVSIAYGDGLGRFGDAPGGRGAPAARPDPPRALPAPGPLGGAADILAVADLDADGLPDLVTQGGIYFVRGVHPWVLEAGALATGMWDSAVVADFNRDGTLDVAAISGGGAASVELLVGSRRRGAYTRQRAQALGSAIRQLRVGDFDGDRFPDLAAIVDRRHVTVFFSDAQGLPRRSALVGDLGGAERIVPASNAEGTADDLVVTARPTEARRTLTRFLATGSALMRASIGFGGPLRAVALGRFGAGGTPGVVLVGGRPTSALPGPRPGDAAWLLDGGDGVGGTVPVLHPLAATGCDAIVSGEPPLLVVADLDGDGTDELVAVGLGNSNPNPVMGPGGLPRFRVAIARVQGSTLACQALDDLSGVFNPRAASIADVDGDGHPELIVTLRTPPPKPDDPDFVPPSAPPPGVPGTGFAIYFGAASDAGVALTSSPAYYPVDQMRAVAAVGGQLAVVSDTGSFLQTLTADRSLVASRYQLPLGVILTGVDSLLATDVDGDGLDDIVVGGTTPAVMLQQECDARRAAAQQCVRAAR